MNTMLVEKKTEFKTLLSLALPVVITQASETVMLFTDRLFLSALGIEYVAPSMSGGLTSFVFQSFFFGITGYVNAVVAHYYGAGIKHKCSRTLAQAIYISIIAYPILLGITPLMKPVFELAGHAPDQVRLENTFFSLLMLGSIFGLVRSALAGFFIGIGKTGIVMMANLAGMLLVIPLDFVLIFGVFPFPRLEIAGAAIATIAGSGAIMVILASVYMSGKYRKEYGTQAEWKPDSKLFGKLIYFGLPSGIELFLDVGAFNIFIILMHSINKTVAAATTITFNYDLVAFIPMIGLNAAIMSLVGRHMGIRDHTKASRATYLTMRLAYGYAGFMMLVFVFGAPLLVRAFVHASGGQSSGEVVSLSETMLRLAALYTLADATQLVFGGALRGAGDTHWCMIVSVTIHWIMAACMFVMIKILKYDSLFIWGVFIGFVIIMGTVFFIRFRLGRWRNIEMINDDERLEAALSDSKA